MEEAIIRPKILYLFTSGRKKRLEELEQYGEAPLEMFYGYLYLKEAGYHVELLETDDIDLDKTSKQYKQTFKESMRIQKTLGIGSRAHYMNPLLEILNTFDMLIAIPDSIALGLAYWKQHQQLKPRIIYFAMGMADRLNSLKNRHLIKFFLRKKVVHKYLAQFHKVLFLGKGELRFMRKNFPHFSEKFVFCPFGIDTNFWKPDKKSSTNDYILFIGNDPNRDFELLIQLAAAMPHRKFKIISSKIPKNAVSENAELILGDWREATLSDPEIRSYYTNSSLVIIPLKGNTIQPSGQSVALQALSCGKKVIMTQTQGFWDPDIPLEDFNITFVASNTIDLWKEAIEKHFVAHTFNSARPKIEERCHLNTTGEVLERILSRIRAYERTTYPFSRNSIR